MTPARIDALYRYPVKGLTPEALPRAILAPGRTLPADRLYAIENGPSGFDPAQPSYLPKTRFLMLMRNAKLAALRTAYDEATHTLVIRHEGQERVRADLRTGVGRALVEAFMASFMGDELRGAPKVLQGHEHSFSDVAKKVVSIINLATVEDVARVAGQPLDPLRFRGNVHVTGWPAWREFELVGETISLGPVRAKVVKRIIRCPATQVDPTTAKRDVDVPALLVEHFGHRDCGIYAEVIEGGEVAVGDTISDNRLL